MVTSTRVLSIVAFFVPFFLCGCGNRNPNAPANISGKITKKGVPITAGSITFTIQGKGSVSAVIKPDGTYEAAELPEGDAAVSIETESANPEIKKLEYKGGGPAGDFAGKYPGKSSQKTIEREEGSPGSPKPDYAKGGRPGTYTPISARYSDPAQSGFNVTLKKGSNKKDFDLTD